MIKKNFIKVIASVFCIFMLSYGQFGYAKFEISQKWDRYGISRQLTTENQAVTHNSFKEGGDYHMELLLSEVINEKEVEEIINSIKIYKEKGIMVEVEYNCVFSGNADVKWFKGIKNSGLIDIVSHNCDGEGLSPAGLQAFVEQYE